MRKFLVYLAALAGFVATSGNLARAADSPQNAVAAAASDAAPCQAFGPGFFSTGFLPFCAKAGVDLRVGFNKDFAARDLALASLRLPTLSDPNRASVPALVYYKNDYRDRTKYIRPSADAQAYLTLAAQTDYGPVVGFINLHASGAWVFNGHPAFETNATTRGAVQNVVDQASLKFAGFTAGIYPSFFNFTQPGYSFSGGYASSRKTLLLGYTQRIGNFAAISLALEDPSRRTTFEGTLANAAPARLPDVVGQLRLGSPSAFLHLSGAWHQIRDRAAQDCCNAAISTKSAFASAVGAEYRTKWSDVFGAAAGDTYGRVMVTAAYSKGALSYLGIPYFALDNVTEASGLIHRTTAFSAIVAYEHVWTPALKSTVTFSIYRAAMHSSPSDLGNGNLFNFAYRVRGSQLQVGTEYMIRPDVMIGAELSEVWDKARGRYVGLRGAPLKVALPNALIYLRKTY